MKDHQLEINHIINRIPVFRDAEQLHMEQIAGLTNANYLVTADGERFVLRLSGQNTAYLGINRRCEVAALRTASAASIAPELIAFLEPEGHMVTRWVEGYHWDATTFRTPDHVRMLTETVKRIHALPSNGATFCPFQRVAAFLATANAFGVRSPSNLSRFVETMDAVWADQKRDNSDWQRFCHNDLVSVNYLYLEKEQVLKVLDWEFSGLGDIYYDLATVVYTHDSNGPIPPELEDVMLTCYFGACCDSQRRHLAGMKYMLMLFTAAWALVQHGMQTAGLVPLVKEFSYLEFADYLLAHELMELQAQYLAWAHS